MAIKAYSYAKDGNRKLSANFAVKEFRCKDGSDPIFIDDELVTLLQKIQGSFREVCDDHECIPYRCPQQGGEGGDLQPALLRQGCGHPGAGRGC